MIWFKEILLYGGSVQVLVSKNVILPEDDGEPEYAISIEFWKGNDFFCAHTPCEDEVQQQEIFDTIDDDFVEGVYLETVGSQYN